MKSAREILYKALVENLNVDPSFLSRIEGNDPISIELKGGEIIFININAGEGVVQTVIEIPTRDPRITYTKAQKIFEVLMTDEQIFLNLQKDKLLLLGSIFVKSEKLEKELSDKLTAFNKVVNHLKA